jgi:ribosomal protein S27AE
MAKKRCIDFLYNKHNKTKSCENVPKDKELRRVLTFVSRRNRDDFKGQSKTFYSKLSNALYKTDFNNLTKPGKDCVRCGRILGFHKQKLKTCNKGLKNEKNYRPKGVHTKKKSSNTKNTKNTKKTIVSSKTSKKSKPRIHISSLNKLEKNVNDFLNGSSKIDNEKYIEMFLKTQEEIAKRKQSKINEYNNKELTSENDLQQIKDMINKHSFLSGNEELDKQINELIKK